MIAREPLPLKVTFLLLGDCSMLSLASALDPLRAANRLSRGKLFEWRLLSPNGQPVRLTSGIAIPVDGIFDAAATGDILVIVASFREEQHASRPFLLALARACRNFMTVCAVEAGTWLLARSGAVTHHKVTTHWEDFESLAQQFPDLDLRRDRYVIDGKFWTSGGASPAFDMMLQLIRTHHGTALALQVASVFIYDEAHRATDTQPQISLGPIAAREPRVTEAVRIMEAHIDDPLPVSAIARRLRLSIRMLEILCRRHLGEAPGGFYLQLRLQAARKLVLDTRLSMQEIAIRTGFASQSALSRAFRRRYGQSPLKLRLAGPI